MIGALVQVEGIEPTQHYATDLQSAPALQLWRTCIKRRCKHHKDEMHLLEGMTGIEPASSAWKADVLATIRHSHKEKQKTAPTWLLCFALQENILHHVFSSCQVNREIFFNFFQNIHQAGKINILFSE